MSRPPHVLELRSVRGTGGGPEKTILLGAAQASPDRCRVTVCYIRDVRDEVFGIDARAQAMGVDYVEIRERNSFDPSVWSALRRLVRDRRVDIVHAHDYKTDLLAWLLHRWDGMRVLATAHGWSGFSFRERRLYYPADKRCLARLPRVIAVSPKIQDELVRHGAIRDRVTVVLNGIDPQEFKRQPPREADARRAIGAGPGDIVLGAIGRLEIEKRFDLLIEAFARLRPRYPGLRLVIAGEGSLRGELEALARRLGVDGGCQLIGHVGDVRTLHHALDVCVQTSDTEGTPNSILEAMALGTPIVATDAGGTSALVTPEVHGLLVPVGNLDQLVDALERAVTDRGAAGQRAAAARARIERELSFRARMARVEQIYDELMARSVRQAAA